MRAVEKRLEKLEQAKQPRMVMIVQKQQKRSQRGKHCMPSSRTPGGCRMQLYNCRYGYRAAYSGLVGRCENARSALPQGNAKLRSSG